MNKWELNVTNSITVNWLDTVTANSLVAYYKTEDAAGTWINIGALTAIGDSFYTIPYKFTTPGRYLIRVMDINTYKQLISKLTVVDNCACSNTATATIESRIDILDGGLRQILSNLGDEININEVKIDNSAKTMSLTI